MTCQCEVTTLSRQDEDVTTDQMMVVMKADTLHLEEMTMVTVEAIIVRVRGVDPTYPILGAMTDPLMQYGHVD